MGIRIALHALLLTMTVLPVSDSAMTERPNAKFDPIAASQASIQRVLELVNEERAKANLPSLVLNERLCVTARWHAMDMAVGGYFDHKDRRGRSPGQRLNSFGYRFHYCGQNIAAGQQNADEAFEAWMNSPGHRENILRKEFKEIGIAFVQNPNSRYHRYWVQDFGAP